MFWILLYKIRKISCIFPAGPRRGFDLDGFECCSLLNNQVDLKSGCALVEIQLIRVQEAEFPSLLQLGNDKVLDDLSAAALNAKRCDDACVAEIGLGSFDVALGRAVLVAEQREPEVGGVDALQVFFSRDMAEARLLPEMLHPCGGPGRQRIMIQDGSQTADVGKIGEKA